ncbi:MAG: hypothetical protein JNN17_05610 [Verrucomicrobiaceae bacterium]|nr:hypothetical protein [Verrucomicrobiaceae bacterium]
MSLDPVISAAAALQRLDGVAGVLLFKGRHTIHRQMPFSETRAEELRERLEEMLAGYRQVRRRIRQIYLEFDGGVLLVVASDEVALVFFLTSKADPDLAASAGSVLISDHAAALAAASIEAKPATSTPGGIEELVVTSPRALTQITEKAEPVVNQWGNVRKAVEGLLGKVMGRGQASRLIDRTLEAMPSQDPYRLPPAEVRKLAAAILDHVPNTAKRRQLLTELEASLAELQL